LGPTAGVFHVDDMAVNSEPERLHDYGAGIKVLGNLGARDKLHRTTDIVSSPIAVDSLDLFHVPARVDAKERSVIRGSVPQESWSDVFRCFISPAIRMQLKKLNLGIQFEIETSSAQPLDENDPVIKAMREAASQLGLKMEEKD